MLMTVLTYALPAKRDQLEAVFCARRGRSKPHLDLKIVVHAQTGPGAKKGPINARAMLGLREQMEALALTAGQANTRKIPELANARPAERASIHQKRLLLVLVCVKTVRKESIFQPQAAP